MDEINSIRPDIFNKMVVLLLDLLIIINNDESFRLLPPNEKSKSNNILTIALEQLVIRYLQNYITKTNLSNLVQSFFSNNIILSPSLIQINRILLKMEHNELANILRIIEIITNINNEEKQPVLEQSDTNSVVCNKVSNTYSINNNKIGSITNNSLPTQSKKKQKIEDKSRQDSKYFTFSLDEIASYTTRTSYKTNTQNNILIHEQDKPSLFNNIQTDTKTKLINAANLFKCKKSLYIFLLIKYYYLNGRV
jgi:hypothetical protein